MPPPISDPADPTDPTDPTDPAAVPPRGTLARRALTRRCPLCGARRIFRHWFTMLPRCPGCGLRFQREAGHWSGDLGINTIVSFGTLLVVLLGTSLLTYPNIDAGKLLVACAATAIGVPVLFYPFSKTIWLAFDLAVNPLRPGELGDADGDGDRGSDEQDSGEVR